MEFTRPSLVLQYRAAGFDFLYIENEHMLSAPAFADMDCRPQLRRARDRKDSSIGTS